MDEKVQLRRFGLGPISQFALSGLGALVLLGIVGLVLLSREGRAQAIREARNVTRVVAVGIVEPNLTDAVVAGDPKAVAAFDRIVRKRVLMDPVVRVKIWTAQGRVIYSDEPRLIGFQDSLDEDELEALRRGGVVAEEESEFSATENRFERGRGNLLEVYLPVSTTSGQRLLFETYQTASAVTSQGRRTWRAFAPAALAVLVLLWIAQLPLAWSLAGRLQRVTREREALLRRAIEASDVERRRIAGDLHDTVVQDMAGLSFTLAGAANRAEHGSGGVATVLHQAAADARHTARRLRTLLVEIHPPNLRQVGLEAALADVLEPLAERGIRTTVDIPSKLELDRGTEALLFRVAREALRNVLAHADAANVSVRVTSEDGRVMLEVEDDGRGFSAEEVARRRAEGHFGLSLLPALVEDAGGVLQVDSEAGRGTRVCIEIDTG